MDISMGIFLMVIALAIWVQINEWRLKRLEKEVGEIKRQLVLESKGD